LERSWPLQMQMIQQSGIFLINEIARNNVMETISFLLFQRDQRFQSHKMIFLHMVATNQIFINSFQKVFESKIN